MANRNDHILRAKGTSPALLEAANKYTRLGWSLFPVAPIGKGIKRLDGKEPYPGSHGFNDATRDPSQIDQWWGETPEANVGLACAASGLVVLDVDLDLDDEEDAARWDKFCTEVELPDTFTQRTPGGGLHFVFKAEPRVRYPGSIDDAAGKIADVKHKGYILLAPSVARSGRRTAPGSYEIVDDSDPAPAPAWLSSRTKTIKKSDNAIDTPNKPTAVKKQIREVRRKENNTQLLYLLKEARNTIAERDQWLRLGFAIHAGYAGTHWENDAHAAWLGFSNRWEMSPGTKPADLSENADQVWQNARIDRDGMVMPATAQMILGNLPKLPSTDLRPVKSEKQVLSPPGPEIRLSGLAGRIAELVRLASDRELRVFPEAAALLAMSALAAPTFVIRGPQGRTSLCLYGLFLGGTGSGKEACRKATDMALTAAGRHDEMLDGVASDKALHRALSENGGSNSGGSYGARVIAIDEGGLHLDAIRRGNNGHQQLLLALMMRLWGLGLGRLPPHKYADNKNEISGVKNPRLTMMWTSTPEALVRATGQEDSESGQLNRMLVFMEKGFPPIRAGKVDRDLLHTPPEDIVATCSRFPPRLLQSVVSGKLNDEEIDTVVEMSERAMALFEEFRTGEVEDKRRIKGAEGESWARAAEYVLRISGLLALSDACMDDETRELENVICDETHVEQAIHIVRNAVAGTEEVARSAGKSVVEQLKDKVTSAIEQHRGEDGYARSRDVRKSVLRGAAKQQRQDILGTMIEDGEILREERGTKGRPAEYYAIAEDID